MAQTATMYNLRIELSDVDRGIYEKIALSVARQPLGNSRSTAVGNEIRAGRIEFR